MFTSSQSSIASVSYSMFSAYAAAMKVPVPTFFLFDALISGSPITLGYALISLSGSPASMRSG